jgi:hypothetical protein
MALGFSARPPTSSIDAAEGASAEARARLRAGGMMRIAVTRGARHDLFNWLRFKLH